MHSSQSSLLGPVLRAALLLGPSCGREKAATDHAPREPGPTTASATERPSSGTFTEAPPTGPLTFRAQEGWITEQPTSSMRAAQFRLPAGEGEDQDAEVIVFHFGAAGGGGFEANVTRWAGMFEQPDGSPTLERARESSRRVAGMNVREVDLEGTYVAETRPGSGERVREEGWAMRAAMIEAPVGAYYARLVGPQPVVERYEPSFRAFLSELGNREER